MDICLVESPAEDDQDSSMRPLDRPLSPVLSYSKRTFGSLASRRRKSRVKLAEIFNNENSHSSSQSSTKITSEKFENFEKIESERSQTSTGDDNFKVPNAPAVHKKTVKNIQTVEGFQTASGKTIKLSQSSPEEKIALLFKDILDGSSMTNRINKQSFLSKSPTTLTKKDTNDDCFKGFGDSSIHSAKQKVRIFNEVLAQINNQKRSVITPNPELNYKEIPCKRPKLDGATAGFTFASGRVIKNSGTSLKRAQTLFKDIDLKSAGTPQCFAGFKSASEQVSSKAENVFKDVDLSDAEKGNISEAFSKNTKESITSKSTAAIEFAPGNTMQVSSHLLERAQNIFKGIELSDEEKNTIAAAFSEGFNEPSTSTGLSSNTTQSGFKTAKGSSIKISSESLKKAQNTITDMESICNNNSLNKYEKITSNDYSSTLMDSKTWQTCQEISCSEADMSNVYSNSKNSSDISSVMKKSRPLKRLGVSPCNRSLIKATGLERAKILFEKKKLSDCQSPVRHPEPVIFNSTPVKGSDNITPTKNDLMSFLGSEITPIKKESTVVTERGICLQEPTRGNIDLWQKNFNDERRVLEKKLAMVIRKQQVLSEQKSSLQNPAFGHRKRRNGVLYTIKTNSTRINLEDAFEYDFSADRVPKISAENAEMVHFDCSKSSSYTIQTLDGAVIVPNQQEMVGLSEIEIAFKTMPGVESHLIPEGWIRNHYKWIVWKLASYERFTSDMNNCLNLENVVQQLKYRYDREIDRAQRSTLRKIYETDDVPQKRMVLCVAKIYKHPGNNKFNLELTDGWYGIRTVLDDPLEDQVIRGRLNIGTKLVISGAELLNCEGCHPLDTTEAVCLKINFNSTRRAVWHATLGYQKIPAPFPVLLTTLHPSGGIVGCIKIYIARIYPVKYFERQGNLSVWRNQKAENIRAQEWENEHLKRVNEMQDIVDRDYEKSLQSKQNKTPINLKDITNINCPKTLYEGLKQSYDPQKFQEMLSSEQKTLIVNYQQDILMERQNELRAKVDAKMKSLQVSKRDVTPVLTLKVVEASDLSTEKSAFFQIWKPSDSNLEMLKEGVVCRVYNAMFKSNGDLRSTSKTKFIMEPKNHAEFNKYNRTFNSISNIFEENCKPIFDEFDTVGIVVKVETNSFSQHLWMADFTERLLFVKLFEAPKTCMLFDNLKPGQILGISNLILNHSKFEFVEAIANHSTVFSLYPKHKFLQDAIKDFHRNLPMDQKIFLDGCIAQVERYLRCSNSNKTKNHSTLNENLDDSDADESTLVYTRTTRTDVALSSIDIDELMKTI